MANHSTTRAVQSEAFAHPVFAPFYSTLSNAVQLKANAAELTLDQRAAETIRKQLDEFWLELRVMNSPWMAPVLSLQLIGQELRSFQTVSQFRLVRGLRQLRNEAQQQYTDVKHKLINGAITKLDTAFQLDRAP